MLAQIGERLHEEYLAEKREERRRKNLQKLEDEALVRPKKMQKRTEENPLEVKAEDSSDDKDDIPLAQRLEMLNSKAKNGHVKPEERFAVKDVGCVAPNGANAPTREGSSGTTEDVEKEEEPETKMKDSINGKVEEEEEVENVNESVIEQAEANPEGVSVL